MNRLIVWIVIAVVGSLSAGTTLSKLRRRPPALEQAAGGGNRIEVSADLRGHFVVHPSVDGRRVRMLIDTGASAVTLSHEDAFLVGVRLRGSDYTARVSTANGAIRAAPVRLSEVKIGDIVVRGVDALIMPPGALGTSLLGMTFLRRLGGFEIAQGHLVLKG
jgi:aspartyl protease family protein